LQARTEEREIARKEHAERKERALAVHPVYIEAHGNAGRWVAPIPGEISKGFIDIGSIDGGEKVSCILRLNDSSVAIFDAHPGITDIPGIARVKAHDVVTIEAAGARLIDAAIGFVLGTH
jgi:hypothetical protein